MTVDIDNGNNRHVITHYKSTDGETWTNLGSNAVANAITQVDNSAALEVGSVATGSLFAGLVHKAEVRSGIDGTLIAAWDGTWPHTRQRDAYGNIWTVNGTANAWQVVS